MDEPGADLGASALPPVQPASSARPAVVTTRPCHEVTFIRLTFIEVTFIAEPPSASAVAHRNRSSRKDVLLPERLLPLWTALADPCRNRGGIDCLCPHRGGCRRATCPVAAASHPGPGRRSTSTGGRRRERTAEDVEDHLWNQLPGLHPDLHAATSVPADPGGVVAVTACRSRPVSALSLLSRAWTSPISSTASSRRVRPGRSRGRTEASSVLACSAVRCRAAPPGTSSASSRCSRLSVGVRVRDSSSRRSASNRPSQLHRPRRYPYGRLRRLHRSSHRRLLLGLRGHRRVRATCRQSRRWSCNRRGSGYTRDSLADGNGLQWRQCRRSNLRKRLLWRSHLREWRHRHRSVRWHWSRDWRIHRLAILGDADPVLTED